MISDNPREIAVRAVSKIETEQAYSNLIVNNLLRDVSLKGEDKALATLIIYGTLDRKITIDFFLKQFIKTPLKRIKPYTLAVLRTAVYQIKFADRIPNSAAVDEAVKLIKRSKESFNSGFVNAVLRSISQADIALPDGNDINSISVRYSCPALITAGLIKDYGIEDTKLFLENSLLAPPIYLRVNSTRISTEDLKKRLNDSGIETQIVFDNALKAEKITNLEKQEAFVSGLFHIEELACQKAIANLNIEKTDRVLDVCAAPGGKSFTAAEEAFNGEVVACDLYEHRTSLIASGAERLELNNIITMTLDATKSNFEENSFDKIICDVPCSGFGVIRRKPEIKYKPTNDFEELIFIQKGILNTSARYLRKGGRLLYSTCTLHKAENEEVVNSFLENNRDFRLINMHTFMPHKDGTDGFFAAVIEKI